jgi:hypothetical protein
MFEIVRSVAHEVSQHHTTSTSRKTTAEIRKQVIDDEKSKRKRNSNPRHARRDRAANQGA